MHRPITTTARIGLALTLAVALLLTAVPASAGGAGFVSLRATNAISAGQVVKAKARLSRPADRCRLQMRHRGARGHATSAGSMMRARLLWRWRVPARARGGVWRLRVTCRRANGRRSADRERLRVRGSRRGRMVSVGRRRPGILNSGQVLGGRGGSGQQGSGPRPRSGECTDWANHKRPDIMRSNPRAYWIAYAWDDLARRAGYKVNQQPAAGTIAVWEANRGGAFWAGHVAYVKSVARNGAVTISEMNWNGIRTPTKRVLNSSQVRAAEFIHHR